jgi:hypothetical protein
MGRLVPRTRPACFGSLSVIAPCPRYVSFTAESGLCGSATGMSAWCDKQAFAEQQKASYSITSSTVANSVDDTLSPSAFAVFEVDRSESGI